MLRYLSYNIVFQEVPGEVALAVNLSNCPNRCKGCHSPYLQEDAGEELDQKEIGKLLTRYGNAVTCVCFMGGDADPQAVEKLSLYIRTISRNRLKTAWYSGKPKLPEHCSAGSFDYIKLGPYVEKFGGLDSADTNQRFYRVEDGVMKDLTTCFRKNTKKYDVHGFDAK
jgi:anaerobic ribonucleoside-triphosphate reductase activating protein